jgi:glucokinase
VLSLHGPECPGNCPGIGCFEALVSGTAIGREGTRVAEAAPESALGRRLAAEGELGGGIVTELAHAGDELARRVLAVIGERLGFGLVGLVNTFNPEVIVIGGGAARGGDLLLDPARAVIDAHALPPAAEAVRVVPAHYGDEAGMIGAAVMALESLR